MRSFEIQSVGKIVLNREKYHTIIIPLGNYTSIRQQGLQYYKLYEENSVSSSNTIKDQVNPKWMTQKQFWSTISSN